MVFISHRVRLAFVVLAASIVALPAWADDGKDCRHSGSLRLVNGRIHTMDTNDQIVSSVLVKNGRFAAVGHGRGSDDGDCARTINLHGRTVVPGATRAWRTRTPSLRRSQRLGRGPRRSSRVNG
jgi:hypothetical protein